MKKIMIILLIYMLTCVSHLVWAQAYSTSEQRAQLLTQIMIKRIPLKGSVEYEQVLEINLKYARLIQGQLAKTQNKRMTFRKIKELHIQRENELRALFDYDQMRNYQILKKELINKMKDYHNTN